MSISAFKQYRLAFVLGLLLVPIGLLGWLFHMQSTKDIAFVQRELMGVDYLRPLVPILANVSGRDETAISGDVAMLHMQNLLQGGELNIASEGTALQTELAKDSPSRMEVVRSSMALISKVGDNSNLILDPDLDSYYLMDVSVLRVPQMLSTLHQLDYFASWPNEGDLDQKSRATVLLLGGQIQSNIAGIEQSTERAFKANTSGDLLASLQTPRDLFVLQANELVSNIIVTSGQLGKRVDGQKLRALNTKIAKFWLANTNQLQSLLQTRQHRLTTARGLALGFSVIVTMLALALAISVMRQHLSRLDEKIVYLAHHDPMTQLVNRSSFSDQFKAILKEIDGTGERIALHVLDIDRFKSINDTQGHPVGDELLAQCAERLLANARKSDVVARLGGDEFIVLQRHIENDGAAAKFADRLVDAMREPFKLKAQVLRTSMSCGTAESPLHSSDSQALMAFADMALYAAKAAGRNKARSFSRDLDAEVKRRQRVEVAVRNGLSGNCFHLQYQPQFTANGSRLTGFEALLRLEAPDGEKIGPIEFIPVAEQLGLIAEIGKWVLHDACKTAALWPEELRLAVNLSPLQFVDGKIAGTIAEALAASGLKASRLQVEITENILLEDTQAVVNDLQAIRALGVTIAMDDFGTGYSSLSYLWRFKFDKIKIDRSFMQALENDKVNAENILRSIVTLGHSLEMTVTAEGVETPDQADLMSALKCDEIQGYFYGRPQPQEALAQIILKSFQSEKQLLPSIANVDIRRA